VTAVNRAFTYRIYTYSKGEFVELFEFGPESLRLFIEDLIDGKAYAGSERIDDVRIVARRP
jgi:hypothetical protein